MIYLDSAATTLQKPARVYRAVGRALRDLASPGRGGYPAAMEAAEEAYRCREAAAALFDAEGPERVVFTMNATHALNIAVKSLLRPGGTALISGYAHNAVVRPLHALGARILTAEAPPFLPERMLEAFSRQLGRGVQLAVTDHVSNVFGCVQPVEEIASLCRQYGVPLVVDASQSAGCLPVRLRKWQAAFVAMPGHKGLYGPQGTGLLLCGEQPGGGQIRTLLEGGTGVSSRDTDMPDFLPERLEAGTHNMPGIAGLRAGLAFVEELGPERILRRERELVRLAAALLEDIPGLELFRAEEPENQTGVLSFRLEGRDCAETAEALARRGFALRAGLHCAPLAHRSAGTLDTGTVRLSVSVFNRESQIRRLGEALASI